VAECAGSYISSRAIACARGNTRVAYMEGLPADKSCGGCGVWCVRHAGALAWRRGPAVCACTRVCWCRRIVIAGTQKQSPFTHGFHSQTVTTWQEGGLNQKMPQLPREPRTIESAVQYRFSINAYTAILLHYVEGFQLSNLSSHPIVSLSLSLRLIILTRCLV